MIKKLIRWILSFFTPSSFVEELQEAQSSIDRLKEMAAAPIHAPFYEKRYYPGTRWPIIRITAGKRGAWVQTPWCLSRKPYHTIPFN